MDAYRHILISYLCKRDMPSASGVVFLEVQIFVDLWIALVMLQASLIFVFEKFLVGQPFITFKSDPSTMP